MNAAVQEPAPRIEAIDALRGSALAGILLLHAVAHWSLPRYPTAAPAWLAGPDRLTAAAATFLFEGKAYAVFALMFGVSFALILDHWSRRGPAFAGRFTWRLVLLAGLGYLHGLVYAGDILLTLAILGLPLLLLRRLGDRALGVLALLLLLQIPTVWGVARQVAGGDLRTVSPLPLVAYDRLAEVYAHGSFAETCAANAFAGQVARLWWAVESGRHLQALGLFACGLLVGRRRLLEQSPAGRAWARRILLGGLGAFALLFVVRRHLADFGLEGEGLHRARDLLGGYRNLAQVAVWVGAFLLLYRREPFRRALRLLAPYGRMSLTSYVVQGLVGVPLFYGYGLGLYRHFGPFLSLLTGIALLAAQGLGAHLWLRQFRYGPLEWLWRSATFLDFSTPLRRRARGQG